MFIIVGFKRVVAKKNGSVYYELHCLSDDKFIIGQRCDTFFVSENIISDLTLLVVGASCNIVFNRYGRVDEVVVL